MYPSNRRDLNPWIALYYLKIESGALFETHYLKKGAALF